MHGPREGCTKHTLTAPPLALSSDSLTAVCRLKIGVISLLSAVKSSSSTPVASAIFSIDDSTAPLVVARESSSSPFWIAPSVSSGAAKNLGAAAAAGAGASRAAAGVSSSSAHATPPAMGVWRKAGFDASTMPAASDAAAVVERERRSGVADIARDGEREEEEEEGEEEAAAKADLLVVVVVVVAAAVVVMVVG